MAAYNFQKRFFVPILAGIKTQTIRPVGKRRHVRRGEKLQIYTGQRTSSCTKIIEDPVCLSVVSVTLDFRNGAFIEIGKQWQPISPEFARRDGFESVAEMAEMFTQLYGEEDMKSIVSKQLEKAKAGDVAAAKFMINLVGSGNSRPIRIEQNIIVGSTEEAANAQRTINGTGNRLPRRSD